SVISFSYCLPGALVFFIGFFASTAVFRLAVLFARAAHLLMVAAVSWVLQIHLSWPLLLPFAGWAWLDSRRDGVRALVLNVAAFAAGAFAVGIFLVPTIWQYGLRAGDGGTVRNFTFHLVNPWTFVTTLARFLSFASLEVNRFIGTD